MATALGLFRPESDDRRNFRWYSRHIEACVTHADRLVLWAHRTRNREFRLDIGDGFVIDPRTEIQSLLEQYALAYPLFRRFHGTIVQLGAHEPVNSYGAHATCYHELGEQLAEQTLESVARVIGSELFTVNRGGGAWEAKIQNWWTFLTPLAFEKPRPLDHVRSPGLPCDPKHGNRVIALRKRLRCVLLDLPSKLLAGLRQERHLVLGDFDKRQRDKGVLEVVAEQLAKLADRDQSPENRAPSDKESSSQKRGRPVSEKTMQRRRFCQPLLDAGMAPPRVYEAYRDRYPDDCASSAAIRLSLKSLDSHS